MKKIKEQAEYITEILNDSQEWDCQDDYMNFVTTELYNLLKLIKEEK